MDKHDLAKEIQELKEILRQPELGAGDGRDQYRKVVAVKRLIEIRYELEDESEFFRFSRKKNC